MAINKYWARWIKSSINKHFETNLVDSTLLPKIFYEPSHRANEKEQKIIEVRDDGGYWTETTKDQWNGIYEINLLVQFYMDDNDLYIPQDLIGLCCEAMSKPISIFKYGPYGDDSFLTCFKRLTDHEDIIVHEFGQIDPTLKIVQATIEAHYLIELKS